MKKNFSITATPPAAAPRPPATVLPLVILLAIVVALAGSAFSRNRIYQSGLTIWESMVTSSPQKRRPHLNFGIALSLSGRFHEALSEFNQVLAQEDDGSVQMYDLHREIGVAYFKLGLYDEAIVAFRKGLEFAPDSAGLLNNLAAAFSKQKRYDEAISQVRSAIMANPSMPEPVDTLGEIYIALGKFSLAADEFKKYVYLRPESLIGYWKTALTLSRAGRYEEALLFANQFRERLTDPRDLAMVEELIGQINADRMFGKH